MYPRNINNMSSFKFLHFQEACIEKIVKFIYGDERNDRYQIFWLLRFCTLAFKLYENIWIKYNFRLESWCASSQHSYGRQNTYNRTISNDSNANSIRSESDNYTNHQWLLGPTTQLATAQDSPLPPPRKYVPYRPPHHTPHLSVSSTTPRNSTRSFSPARSISPSISTMGR